MKDTSLLPRKRECWEEVRDKSVGRERERDGVRNQVKIESYERDGEEEEGRG